MGEIKTTKALVYFKDKLAGELVQVKSDEGVLYHFQYHTDYLKDPNALGISYHLPLRPSPYESDVLFPFFEGLVSEGWLLKIQGRQQKIDERDTFSMLIENGEDLIGAVTVLKAP